ncbi:hypothetical protein [uncultured Kordia sp.]|uniref:hypothetical protein n=1 Tax=uncultured Kordia sp. TaxID=507699 RepID=UPI0026151C0F|nr:hypothetical protein [uncultured Kordia sp.]
MLKNLKNLKNAKTLNKQEQQAINGGRLQCAPFGVCIDFGWRCSELKCRILL